LFNQGTASVSFTAYGKVNTSQHSFRRIVMHYFFDANSKYLEGG